MKNNIDFRNAESFKIMEMDSRKITKRNFSGRADEYNEKGERKFSLLIEDEHLIELLENDGWNIKIPDVEPGEPLKAYLPVFVSWQNPKYIPTIAQVTEKNGKQKVTYLTEKNIGNLDGADIERISVQIAPKVWYKKGTTTPGGIKAYLKKMWFVLIPDEMEALYITNPDYDEEDGITLPFDEE